MKQEGVSGTAILPPPSVKARGQNQLLFRIYLLYRVLLSGVFLLLLTLPPTQSLVARQIGRAHV